MREQMIPKKALLQVCAVYLLSLTLGWPSFAVIRSADISESNSQSNMEIYPEDPLDLGKQYVKEKRYELAVDTYTKALRESSAKFSLYIGRSRAYIGLKQYENALADAELAIRDRPDHPLGYSNRGFAYSLMNKLDKGIADFSKAIELSPSTSQFYALRGAANLEFGRPQLAVDDLSVAIQTAKGVVNPLLLENRALAFRQLGRYEEALRDLSESLRIDPSFSSSRLRRGSVYRCLDKYELAKRDLDEVINHDPDHLEAHLQRAFVSMDQNDFKSALEDLEYVDRKGMKDVHLFLSLAYAHYRLGNKLDAIRYNEKATLSFPDKLQAVATLQKGIFFLASGKLDAGLELLSVGQELARKDKNPESIQDTLDDLDQLEVQGRISSRVVERNREGLAKTLKDLKSLIGIRQKCHERGIP